MERKKRRKRLKKETALAMSDFVLKTGKANSRKCHYYLTVYLWSKRSLKSMHIFPQIFSSNGKAMYVKKKLSCCTLTVPGYSSQPGQYSEIECQKPKK